ncbi:MAG: hypothetical protein AB1454_12040 [Candidatus Auribacterota bacterium]
MICSKCGNDQIGGMFCTKCGKKLKQEDAPDFTATEETGRKNSSFVGITPSHEPKIKKSKQEKKFTAFSKKSELPPPPESVKRKIGERDKFKRKGIMLLWFWISNMLMRSLESVLFSGFFHIALWGLLLIGNFFGGLVAPEAEVKYPLLILERATLYKWEYIAFGIITIFTFRKRWGT